MIEWACSLCATCNFLVRLFSYQILLWRVLCLSSPFWYIWHISRLNTYNDYTKDFFCWVPVSYIHTHTHACRHAHMKTSHRKKLYLLIYAWVMHSLIDMLCLCSTMTMNHSNCTHTIYGRYMSTPPAHKKGPSNIGEPANIIQSTHTHVMHTFTRKANKWTMQYYRKKPFRHKLQATWGFNSATVKE